MRRMRKTAPTYIITALMIACMVLGLCGCSKKNSGLNDVQSSAENSQGELAQNTQTEPEKQKKPYEAESEVPVNTSGTDYVLKINTSNKIHDISELLYGIFFEDINFAADGGLYAEMIQNRSFEFKSLASGNEFHAWTRVLSEGASEGASASASEGASAGASENTSESATEGASAGASEGFIVSKISAANNLEGFSAKVVTNDPQGALNVNNPNYLLLENFSNGPAGVANKGFLEGMAVKENDQYKLTFYARKTDGDCGRVIAGITVNDITVAEAAVEELTTEWKQYTIMLTSPVTATAKVKCFVMLETGSAAFDMISLFPTDTYKGRENGLRRDMAEMLEALKPAFLRFPGGCVIEGSSLVNAYDWKDSVGADKNGEPLLFNGTYGDVAARKMGQDIWTNASTTNDPYPSFMTYGLGFYEYFLLAEDIGAVGVPVVNCGISCMGRPNTQEAVIGTAEFERYIKDALDLVEFCRGDATTTWGAVRTAMGHEAPFALKYIAVGNEQFGAKYYKHYEKFVEAFDNARQERPELFEGIELIYSTGLDDGDSGAADYMASYREADKWLKENPGKTITDFAGATDQHYYNPPEWFRAHNDYYDESNYSRDTEGMTTSRFGGAINVFLGEYAAQTNTLRGAIAEASYMTGLERNGDIVVMAAYAPLFGNTTAAHWSPDLIWFNNHTVTGSISYYMQKLFSCNAGTGLLESEMTGAEKKLPTLSGMIGVGTWNTSAEFDDIVITDNATGEILAQTDFSTDSFRDEWLKATDGTWSVENGVLAQKDTKTDTVKYDLNGTAAYFGDPTWKNYTLTLKAKKTGGSEGFLIPFAVKNRNENYFWNIGGWSNTCSCLQQVSGGSKSFKLYGTDTYCRIDKGKTYELKVVVEEDRVRCYINDKLYVDYGAGQFNEKECYHVVSSDDNGDVIIKLVNVEESEKTIQIELTDANGKNTWKASVDQCVGHALTDDNILEKKEAVIMESFEYGEVGTSFIYTIPPLSATAIRLK